MRPEIKYAKNGDVNIAYSVLGSGPIDIIVVPGFLTNIDFIFDHPSVAQYYLGIATVGRVIIYDKRGSGLSDRDGTYTKLEDHISDLLSLMDTVGSKKAIIYGASQGGSAAMLFAAMHPERTLGLATFNAYAKSVASENYPGSLTREQRLKAIESVANYSFEISIAPMAPSMANDAMTVEWWKRTWRNAVSPGTIEPIIKTNLDVDVCSVLPSIHVPTVVMHRKNERHINLKEGRWIADQIPDAKFVEIDGIDHLPFFESVDQIIDAIKDLAKRATNASVSNRVLTTIVFADIVGSTALATRIGDSAWREKWEAFVELSESHTKSKNGRTIKHTGDGFLALYDGPAKAVNASQELTDKVKTLGLEIRTGVHTGEIEIIGDDIGGIGVHIASRVMDRAGAGEVFVSSTVKGITAGAGLSLEDKGEHELKGIEGKWKLYRALDPKTAQSLIE